MLRKRVAGLLNDRHSFVYSIATASPIKGPTLSVCVLLAEGWVDLCVREEAHSLWHLADMLFGGLCVRFQGQSGHRVTR